MILDKFIDTIKPDIIIWQFCENDIFNNSFDLESSDWKYSNRMVRPYYQYSTNTVIYRFPSTSWLYRNFFRHSYFIQILYQKLVILFADDLNISPSYLPLQKRPLFKEAVNITSEIMKKAKKRAGKIPIIAFSACGESENIIQNKEFSDICNQLDISYISGIPDSIRAAVIAGEKVNGLPYDAHWNENGNTIVGKILTNYLENHNLVELKN